MKWLVKAFAALGFGLAAGLVGQVAWNMTSDSYASSWAFLAFFPIGAAVGWYRVK